MKKLIIALILSFSLVSNAYAAEMIMFAMKSCGYCRAFLKDVAPTYSESEYALLLPLRVISMDRPVAPKWYDDAFRDRRIEGIRVTPTFVIFDNGEEVARLMGYRDKKTFYRDIKDFVDDNREELERTAGRNPIPYEVEHELDPKHAYEKWNQKEVREEGSHSKSSSVPQQQHPTGPFFAPDLSGEKKEDKPNIHNHQLEKLPNGVFNSRDIMDHIYDTETEAQVAANWLGCMGTHSHIIKGKKVWMPCRME